MKKIFSMILVILMVLPALALANDQEPVKAYKTINFGDSFDTVCKKAKADNFSYYNTVIGDVKFQLKFDYYNDQLYRVRFIGKERNANYFDTYVKDEENVLIDVISHSYGEASYFRDLEFYDMESGYIIWSHIWHPENIGAEKQVKIGIGEYEFTYYPVMWIEYLPLLEKKEAEEKAKNNEEINDSADDF